VEWNHWNTMATSRARLSVGVFSLGVQRLTCSRQSRTLVQPSQIFTKLLHVYVKAKRGEVFQTIYLKHSFINDEHLSRNCAPLYRDRWIATILSPMGSPSNKLVFPTRNLLYNLLDKCFQTLRS
jgi:hypothetical protein